MKIRVTRADIRKGFRGSPIMCPIARAARRQGLKRVSVAWYGIKTRSSIYDLPKIAYTFMRRFDNKKPVKAFSFIAKESL